MRGESHRQPRFGKISRTATLLALSVTFVFLTTWRAQAAKAEEDTEKERPALARFSSWVLFGGRAVKGTPFLAYGYLSEIEALPRITPQPADNESSALLSFVTEGTVVDIQQNPPALFITSRGTLRFFFDPQANRDFAEPKSFRSGKEIATYEIERRVLFEPDGGWLLDSSSAWLVSSHDFTYNGGEKNLARLWGSQLTLQSRAHAGNGLPSPLPQFSGAIPYSGKLFIGGERTERQLPKSTSATILKAACRTGSSFNRLCGWRER